MTTNYQAILDSQPKSGLDQWQQYAANLAANPGAASIGAPKGARPISDYTFQEDPSVSLPNPYNGGTVTGLGRFVDKDGNVYSDASGRPYLMDQYGHDMGWWNESAQDYGKNQYLDSHFFANPANWPILAIAGASAAGLATAGGAAAGAGGAGAGITSGAESFVAPELGGVLGESTFLPEAGAAAGAGGAGAGGLDALAAEAGVAPGSALTTALPEAANVADFGVGPGIASQGGGVLGALKGTVMNPDGSINWTKALETFGNATNPNSKEGSGGALGSLAGIFTNSEGMPAWGKIAGAGLGALGAAYGMSKAGKQASPPPLPASMTAPLIPLNFQRTVNQPTGRDLLHYGEQPEGEFKFFDDKFVPGHAAGGDVRGPGSGRDDKIDALLSDGEYVMDAETVAMLGDGSLDEGARRLDQMRANLRKHKGAALAKGKFSPDAKAPEQYLPGGKAKGGPIRPDLLMKSLTAPVAPRNSRSAALHALPLPPGNLDRLSSILDKSKPLDLSKLSPEDLEAYRAWLTSILQAKPQNAKGGPIDLSVIKGGLPKPSLAERAAKLDQLQRMIAAYEQAQAAAAQEKKRLGITEGTDPYNQQPKPKLELVKAKGGLVEAQARVAAIQSKLKKAEGGPVKELSEFADKLENALEDGRTDLAVGE